MEQVNVLHDFATDTAQRKQLRVYSTKILCSIAWTNNIIDSAASRCILNWVDHDMRVRF